MEQMIKVINDNLTSVMNGIKTHREVTEQSLLEIKTEMDEKLSVAGEYRQNVEDARNIIANLETEITGLDKDLKELKEKFDEHEFKELLTAGNKSISAKIIKKRSLINEQSGRILELTKKARALKNELIRLRDQKMSIEETLEKDLTLENYYGSRIQSIIEFTEEHPNEIKDYVEIPESDLLSDAKEYENVDIKKIVDGSIFEEIDEISTHAPELDENQIKEVLVNSEDIPEDEEKKDVEMSMTQQLDDIILQANDLIEKSMQPDLPPIEELTDEIKEEVQEEAPKEEEELEKTDVMQVVIPEEEFTEIREDHILSPEGSGEVEPVNEVEETTDFEEDIDEEKMLEALNAFSLENKENAVQEEEIEEEEKDNDALELMMENDETLKEIEDMASLYDEEIDASELASISDEELHAINENFEAIINEVESEDLESKLNRCRLDINRFKEEDLTRLHEQLDVTNALNFIEVMKQHNIAVSRIYECVDVLLQVTPEKLDQMLTLLERTGVHSNTINIVFDQLHKINLQQLEEEINANPERELGAILIHTLPEVNESDLQVRLGLTDEEMEVLGKSASEEDLKVIHTLPEIVIANYNELKKYEIENLNECFTRRPHRFTLNPEKFAEILDKYDPEDLIRCIHKNVAVIDKL